MSEDLISRFCIVTGADNETASNFLNMCNADLDVAVSMYMDNPNVPFQPQTVDCETECRSPIPQRMEQLLPVEIPLYPGPFARPLASLRTRRRAFVTDDSDEEQQQLSTRNRGTIISNLESSNSVRTRPTSSQVHRDITVNNLSHTFINGSRGASARKRGHLRQLFRPPTEIMFTGTLLEAQATARDRRQWLLVSVHDEVCFDCHILNRDVWKDPRVYQTIKRNFVFLQLSVDSPEGLRYRSHHSYVNAASHIAILDPFTGDQKILWTHLKDPNTVNDVLNEYLNHSTLELPCNGVSHTPAMPVDDETVASGSGQINSISSSSSIGHSTRKRNPALGESMLYPSKRSRHDGIDLTNRVAAVSSQIDDVQFIDPANPLDMSEDEQLRLAIEASKTLSNGDAARRISPTVDPICLTDDEDDHSDSHCSTTTDDDNECCILDPAIISPPHHRTSSPTRPIVPFPVPTDENTMKLAVRLPSGDREVICVPSDMKIKILLDHFGSRGFPSSQYEIIRLHPHKSLSTLPTDSSLTEAGLTKNDTLYIQEI